MGQSFDLMPTSERVRRYREMAAAACDLADSSASLDGKADYLRLASLASDGDGTRMRIVGSARPSKTCERLKRLLSGTAISF